MNNNDIKHLVRATDPLTSINAAENSVKFSGGHKAMILEALKDGAKSVRALERCTELSVVQLDRRMAEMKAAKSIELVMLTKTDALIQEGTRVYRLPVYQLEIVL
jgi:hypothetical protein